MTNEEIVARGIRAQAVLTDATIGQAVDELIRATNDTFLLSKPEQTAEREQAYYMYQGIRDLVGLLNQWVWAKEQIMQAQTASEEIEGN